MGNKMIFTTEQIRRQLLLNPNLEWILEQDAERYFMRKAFTDKLWMPYDKWKKKFPYLNEWLENNGFRYHEEHDIAKEHPGVENE